MTTNTKELAETLLDWADELEATNIDLSCRETVGPQLISRLQLLVKELHIASGALVDL